MNQSTRYTDLGLALPILEKMHIFGDNKSIFRTQFTTNNQDTMTSTPIKKTVKKRPRRSQQDIMASGFLRWAFAPARSGIRAAWMLDVLAVLVLVGQAWLLARIFGGWLTDFVQGNILPDPVSGQSFWYNLAILFICLCLRIGLVVWRDKILGDVGLATAKTMRKRLLDKLGELGLARRYFGSDGALASKIIDEPDHLIGYARFETQKLTCITTPVILAVCIAFYSKTAAWILLLSAPLVPVLMAVIGIAAAKKSREQMDALAQLGGRFLDWIRGIGTLSRLGAVDVATSDIATSSEYYRARTMAVLKIAFLNSAALELLSACAIAVVAVYLGFGLMGLLPWSKGQVLGNYEAALFILLLVPEFYAPLRRLGAEYHIKGQAVAAASSLAPMLGFAQKQGCDHLVLKNSPAFSLTDVTVFGDDGRIRLPRATLNFGKGQCTALVGESGAGKSTVLQVLLGFGEFSGELIIHDGDTHKSYKELDVSTLRRQFGYLSQTPPLLPISIQDNLRLAKVNASDDELWHALALVQMDEVVRSLPHGLATVLGERGGGLSGGQGQRLAIAQLLLQDAKVWLLDEPTEHLDADTAMHIRALLGRLGKQKTVIWATHDALGEPFDALCDLTNPTHSTKGQTNEI